MIKLILLAVCCFSLGNLSSFQNKRATSKDYGIVGGEPANIDDVPWQVSCQIDGIHFCGGTLVAPNWVITAAHCLEVQKNLNIRYGSNYTTKGGDTVNVESVIIHPEYNEYLSPYDIALLKLVTNINDADSRLATLPDADQYIPDGTLLTVSGWGVTESGGDSDILLQIVVPTVNQEQCNKSYGGQITDDQICAGFLGTGGKDSCSGDSGGPAVLNRQLIGVVSWGYECGDPNFPGVYARITALRKWISENTGF